MALAILTISCLLFYSTSKYFPLQEIKWLSINRNLSIWIASALSLLSLALFTISLDFTTSLIFWMIALMTVLSAIILSVKMNVKWIWVWGGLCLLFVIIDLV